MILDRVLLVVARSLLRVSSPDRALVILRGVASTLPGLTSLRDAQTALHSLGNRGSCLARSLAVAARAPMTQVAIGVDPRGGRFLAHAWLEHQGQAVGEPRGEVIVRLPPTTTAGGRW
jgi:hypothetical protein